MPPRKVVSSLAEKVAELKAKRGLKIAPLTEFDMTVKSITTGNVAIDSITGVGGLPRGRVIECYGPPSSGKTTTSLQAAARLQKAGGKILFLDYEKSLDETYCKALGIDISDESFLVMQPNSFEEGANVFRDLMMTGELDMLIADSVAAMVTENELAADTGKANVADRAKMMAQFMRQITGPIQRYQIVAVFLNHLQEIIDISPMGQKLKAAGVTRKTTPGGSALKFYAGMRMEYKPIGNIRNEVLDALTNETVSEIRQTKVQVTVVKNKVAAPFKQCEVRVRWGKGFSQAYSSLDVLVNHKAVKKNGAMYTFPPMLAPQASSEGWQGRGEESVLLAIESDPDWQARLESQAVKLLAEYGAEQADASEWADQDTEGVQVQAFIPDDEDIPVDEQTGEVINAE
jgi:recombination protein RecA